MPYHVVNPHEILVIGGLRITSKNSKNYRQVPFFLVIGAHSLLMFLASIKATSHMRLRARQCYTSSTLISEEGGVGPSSLHTELEGPSEYVNAR